MKQKQKAVSLMRALLAVGLFLTSTALWAADTDGDGVADTAMPSQLSVGGIHACVLDDNGVHCWGYNNVGQTSVPTLVNPTAVSAGDNHTCALDDNGVQCWGFNTSGQTTVPVLTNPIAVSAGGSHTCALDDSGVQCWGDSTNGRTTVPSLTHPTQNISASMFSTCALDDSGVHCWGNNFDNVPVPSLTNPVMVSMGGFHACALDDSGVQCWGDNTHGQITVPALTNPVAVSAGFTYTCAVDDGGVHCWGNNDGGQTTVPLLTNPMAVSTSDGNSPAANATCAQDDTGVHCWGGNTEINNNIPSGLAFTRYADNCPLAANTNQVDGDGDGLGDACDPLPADGNNLNVIDGTVKAEKSGSVVAYVGDFNKDGFGDYAIGKPKMNKGAGRVEIRSGNDGSLLHFEDGVTPKGALGSAIAGNADINGDGFADVVVGEPLANDSTKGVKAVGRVVVVYGCVGVACTPSFDEVYGTEVKAMFGAALALGDVDNDGQVDVAIGSPKADDKPNKHPDAGSVQVLSGSDLQGTPLLAVYGKTTKAYAGTAVAAGDFDGLPGVEVVVGAPMDDGTGIKNAGTVRAYKFMGPSTEPDEVLLYFGAANDHLGQSVAAGADINGDGVNDVLVGVPGKDMLVNNKNLKDVGGVCLFYGGSNQRSCIPPPNVEARAGMGASVVLGDINADGYADLIVGAPKGDNPTALPKPTKDNGTVTVFSGDGFTQLGSTQYGAAKGDAFGTSVSAGDINGDGKADIVVGIPSFDIPANGSIKAIKDAGSVKIINATVFNL